MVRLSFSTPLDFASNLRLVYELCGRSQKEKESPTNGPRDVGGSLDYLFYKWPTRDLVFFTN